jgi:hypothetical protein
MDKRDLVRIKIKREGHRYRNKRRSYWWPVVEITWNYQIGVFYGYKIGKGKGAIISLAEFHEIQKIEGPDLFGGNELRLIKVPVPNKKSISR